MKLIGISRGVGLRKNLVCEGGMDNLLLACTVMPQKNHKLERS